MYRSISMVCHGSPIKTAKILLNMFSIDSCKLHTIIRAHGWTSIVWLVNHDN